MESGTTTFYNTPITPGNLNCQNYLLILFVLYKKTQRWYFRNDCIDANLGIGDKITMVDATNSIVDGLILTMIIL